jgi:hypothetical protein
MSIRSLLWIGRARGFAGDLIADAPSLDVTWERNVELALAHSFDALDLVQTQLTGNKLGEWTLLAFGANSASNSRSWGFSEAVFGICSTTCR